MAVHQSAAAMPAAWWNVLPRLIEPLAPALHPTTRAPLRPDDLAPLFASSLVDQETSSAPWIDIPGPVLDVLGRWRPTPLVRAYRLERSLQTPARIYVKDESVSPTGSHKPNTAVAQAHANRSDGVARVVSETGAGHWGAALAFACAQFELACTVYMVRSSHGDEARRQAVEAWGATCLASPVIDPSTPGSLGEAISDAVRDASGRADTHYATGSVMNHVLLHQTVIGLEAREQLIEAGEDLPDVVIAPCGGGSNLGGLALPFVDDPGVRLVAVEPSASPTLTEGRFGYDHGDVAGLTPLLAGYTLGHDRAGPLHADGVRYRSDAPIISELVRRGRMEAMAYPAFMVAEACRLFAASEGRLAAPETGHGLRAAIDEAIAARDEGRSRVILVNYSGHTVLPPEPAGHRRGGERRRA